MAKITLRSRIDRGMLRAHARLDTRSADIAISWLFVLVLFVVLEWFTLVRYWGLGYGSELASAVQGFWLIGEGYWPDSTLLGESYIAQQASFIIYPLAQLTKIFPPAQTLLTIQALALALGIVPLWKLSRREANLGVGTSVVIIFAYGVSAAIHNMNLAGFHPETLAIPALLSIVLHTRLGRRHPASQMGQSATALRAATRRAPNRMFTGHRHWWSVTPLEKTNMSRRDLILLWILVAVVILSRADLALVIAAYGVLVIIEGREKLGWILFWIGAVWFPIVVWVIQPALSGGDYLYVQYFSEYGTENPLYVIGGMLSQPGDVLRDIFTQSNFITIVKLIAPLVFLPLVAFRYLLPAIPLYALYLVADVPEGPIAEATQTIPLLVFVFVAAVFALKRSGQVLVKRVRVNRQVVVALALAAAVFFIQDSGTSPYQNSWGWYNQSTEETIRLDAVDIVPEDAVVRASPSFLPRLAERVGVYELDTTDQARDDASRSMQGVDWILLDLDDAPVWGNQSLEVQRFATVLRQGGWEQEYSLSGAIVFHYTGNV